MLEILTKKSQIPNLLLTSRTMENLIIAILSMNQVPQDNPKLKFQEDTASLSSTTKMKLLKLKMN